MRQNCIPLLLLSILISCFACTEPTLIGSDLLQEDQANLNFRNDIPIDVKNIKGESVPTYNRFPTLQLEHYLLGQLEDEQFGKSTASLYTQLARSVGRPDPSILVDSLILSFAYDTIGFYGDLSKPFELEVFRVTEDLDPSADYFSNQVFAVEMEPIGSATVSLSLDSVAITNYSNGVSTTTIEPPHIRIPLDELFGELLAEDTTIYQSDTTFQNFFKGLYIKPAASSNGIVPLRFDNAISRLTMYYRPKARDIKQEYRFPFLFSQARVNSFEHIHEGSEVAQTLDINNTDLLYLQSMAGLNMEVNFPDLSSLNNIVINRAELEFTVASNTVSPSFPIVDQLLVTREDQGERTAVIDVRNAIVGSEPIRTRVFGGNPVEETINGVTLTKYRINISAHFQDIVSNTASNSITISAGTEEFLYYLSVVPKAENANQVIFYGTNHPDLAPKLNLTFTTL